MEAPSASADRRVDIALEESCRKCLQLAQDTRELNAFEARLAPLMLSFDNHQRQVWLLLAGHLPLVLAVLLLAWLGGHNHTKVVVGFVYPTLFVAFVLALVAFGARTERIWLLRWFALMFFAVGLWSLAAVLYAVYAQPRMRAWYDVTLLCLQALDILTTIAYLFTADQLAGIGGMLSAEIAAAHHSGLVVGKHTAHLGSVADVNAGRLRTGVARNFISRLLGAFQPRHMHVD